MLKVKDWFGRMVGTSRSFGRLENCPSIKDKALTTSEPAKKDTAASGHPLEWSYMAAGFRRQLYGDYENYVQHQKAKLNQMDLSEYHVEFRKHLKHRLEALKLTKAGDTVLCLGARLGTECLAFQGFGLFAVGIDLNPGDQNLHLLHGDFHYLQFPDNSVDHVFPNALDHVSSLPK